LAPIVKAGNSLSPNLKITDASHDAPVIRRFTMTRLIFNKDSEFVNTYIGPPSIFKEFSE